MSKILNNIIIVGMGIGACMASHFSVQAAVRGSLNDLVTQRVKLKTTKAGGLSEFGNPKNFGNLYDLALQEVERTDLIVFQQAINKTTTNFNEYHNCSLSPDEILSILTDVAPFRINAKRLIPDDFEEKIQQARTQFVAACTKAYTCVSGQPLNTDSAKSYNVQSRDCSRVVHNMYESTRMQLAQNASLQQSNRGDEIFQDGTLENSPYDLLVDIKNIGDVMFAVNKQPTAISAGLFFAFPELSGRPGTNPGGENGQGLLGVSGLTPGGFVAQINNNSDAGNIGSQGSLQANTQGSNGTTVDNKKLNQLLNESIPQLQSTSQNSNNSFEDSNGPVMNENACLTTQEQPQTSLTIDQAIATLQNASKAIDQQNSALDTANAINTQQTQDGITPRGDGRIGIEEELEELDSQISELVDSAVVIGGQYPDERVESCMATCNENYKPEQFSDLQEKYQVSQDLAVCLAKCLCQTVSSPNLAPYSAPHSGQYMIPQGTFQLRLCMVPGQGKELPKKTKVSSIQDVVAQINNVLRKLIESGQLMKHTKTKEFLDTSQKKNSFGKMFSFQFNTAFKSLPNDVNPVVIKAALKQDNTLLEQKVLGLASSLQTDQIDKYLLITDVTQDQTAQEPAQTLQDIEENNEIALEKDRLKARAQTVQLVSEASQAQYVGLSTEIQKFLEGNIVFWNQTTSILNSFNAVTANLKNKVKNAK